MKKVIFGIVATLMIASAIVYANTGSTEKEDDCCKPGAACCYPGSPCCKDNAH